MGKTKKDEDLINEEVNETKEVEVEVNENKKDKKTKESKKYKDDSKMAVVTIKEGTTLILRSTPSTFGDHLGYLENDITLIVLSENTNAEFVKVEDSEYGVGYVMSKFIEIL